jgi:hypothetical protein
MGFAMFRSNRDEGSAREETVQKHSETIPHSVMRGEPLGYEIFLLPFRELLVIIPIIEVWP